MRRRPRSHWAHGLGRRSLSDASEPEDLSTRRRDTPGGSDNRGPATPGRRQRRRTHGTHRRVGLSPHRGRPRAEGRARGPLGRAHERRRARGDRARAPRGEPAGRRRRPASTSSRSGTSRSTTTSSTRPSSSGSSPSATAATRFARRAAAATACGRSSMTKWFDTNYHYLVPELAPGQPFGCAPGKWLAHLAEARALGVAARPVVLGPALAPAARQGRAPTRSRCCPR